MKAATLLTLAVLLISATAHELRPHLAGRLPPDRMLYGTQGIRDNKPTIIKNGTKTATKTATQTKSKRAVSTTTMGGIGQCTNGPTTRNCWSQGYTVATDFDVSWPNTGVTRYYNFVLSNVTCNPDGANVRYCSLINGQIPGPMIRANWGDTIQITLTNNLQYNGTSVHWHGVRQLNNYLQDGTNGITNCPLAPGQTQVYKFQATQFGTSWYHSHHSAQYGDGIFGPIVIDGPTSANWDIDLGPLTVSDWYYPTSAYINIVSLQTQQQHEAPPFPNNILLNGTNMNPAQTTGKFLNITFTPGKKHLLRIINTSTSDTIRVSIDGHTMQLLTADFVPIIPITVQSVLLSVGQRYEVVVTANQTAGNYWLRAQGEATCYSANPGTGLAVITYQGVTRTTPNSTSTYTDGGNCLEPKPLVPWVQNQVGDVNSFISQASTLDCTFTQSQLVTNNQSVVVWGINFTAISVNWSYPTLSYLLGSKNVTQIPQSEALIEIASTSEWVFWIVQEVAPGFPMPHPMHLHGHDFYVLGTGIGIFDINVDPYNLTYTNPTRRDTAIMPSGGWIVMAFPVDNPGAWLMHCHIATHISQGLGVQFLESAQMMTMPSTAYTQQCRSWSGWYTKTLFPEELSGL